MILTNNNLIIYDLSSGNKIYSNSNLMRYTIRQINWLTSQNKLLIQSDYAIGYLDTLKLQKIASLEEIKVDTLHQTLYVGNVYPLHGYFVFSDGTHEPFDASKLDWHVNDFYKAGLENGKIITREPGKVTFTANYLGHSLSVSKVIHSHKPQDADRYVEQEKATNVPAGEYESGKAYTLWIKNLSSSTGQNLGNKVKMDFTTK